MIALELVAPSQSNGKRLCDAVRLFVQATSLGGVESLIEHRGEMPLERQMGTPAGLIRMSVGIEYAGDLIDDLQQALEAV